MKLTKAEIASEMGLAREALSRGDVGGAKSRITFVLRSNPDSPEAHFGNAMICISQEMHAEALASFESALKADPSNGDLLAWAALTCLNLWNGSRAEYFARRLTRYQPQNDRAFFLLSSALSLQGRLEDALEAIDGALRIQPGEPDFIVAKAQLLGRLKWSSQAIEWYRRALQLRPTPELSLELAQSLIDEGHSREALSILHEVSLALPAESQPFELLAQACTEIQEFDAAAGYWASAERLTLDTVGLTTVRANSEIYAGRLGVAEKLLRAALAEDPSAVQFYRPLTTIIKITEADAGLVDEMERLCDDPSIDRFSIRDLNYALGKAYHDLGEFKRAIGRYDEANRIAYEQSSTCQRFDSKAWRAYTDVQIEFFSKERVKQLAAEGLDTDLPLFILGMIRSGTTLTEQILGRHSKVHAGGETTFWPDHRGEVFDPRSGSFDSAAGRRFGQTFQRTLASYAGDAKYATEKNPSNITIAAILHCVFPHAKIVHVKRNPVDNLLSIWMTPIQTGLPFVYNRENLVFAYREYQRLATHLAAVLPEAVFQTFEYEQITSEPEGTIGGMLKFLDLLPEEGCFHPDRSLRTVRTPSFYQVRQPINTESQQKWRRYEPWLGPFSDLLD